MKSDLHMHTRYSDGLLKPEDLLALYARKGYSVISVTDHDNIEGSRATAKIAPKFGIDVIPGVEISSLHRDRDVHILGYYAQPDKAFIDMLDFIHNERIVRAEKMLALLKDLWGFEISMSRLFELSGKKDVIGRPHVAKALVEKGYCANAQEAFEKYIGDHSPAFVRKQSCSTPEVIRAVIDAGGTPVLAHPGEFRDDTMVLDVLGMGVMGLEVYYPTHSNTQQNNYAKMATDRGILMTGGSDFHGFDADYQLVGEFSCPEYWVDQLKQRNPRA